MQGYIVVITRNGSLGGRYPVTSTECVFGQSFTCDVKIYLANVARKHCLIKALPGKPAYICNLSPDNKTLVNGISIGTDHRELKHADLITVGDRHFRWEYPVLSKPTSTTESVEKENHEVQASKVQNPVSTFKKNRHSFAGLGKIPKENKIISITNQDNGEPNLKRRKTIHNVMDLGVENNLVKPVNKRLLAVTQPAGSPKSFNTFRVLLNSTSKRKSFTRVSKTPKPIKKKIISTKIKRTKSLSPPKKQSFTNKVSKEFTSKSTSVEKLLKKEITPVKQENLSDPQNKSSFKQSSPHDNKTPKKINMVKTPKVTDSPFDNLKTGTKRKSSLKPSLEIKTPNVNDSPKLSQKKSISNSVNRRSKIKTPTPEKTPDAAQQKTPKFIARAPQTPTPFKVKSSSKSPKKSILKSNSLDKDLIKGTPKTQSNPFLHKTSSISPSSSLNLKAPVGTSTDKASHVLSSKEQYTPDKSPNNSSLVEDKITGNSSKTPKEETHRKTRSTVKSFSSGQNSLEEQVSPSRNFLLTPKSLRTPNGDATSSKKYISPDKSCSNLTNQTPKETSSPLQNNTPKRTLFCTSPNNLMKNETPGRRLRSRPDSHKKKLSLNKSPTFLLSSRENSPVKISLPKKSLAKTSSQESFSISLENNSQKLKTPARSRSNTSIGKSRVSDDSIPPFTLEHTTYNSSTINESPFNKHQITSEIESASLLMQEVSTSSISDEIKTTRRSRGRPKSPKENTSFSTPLPNISTNNSPVNTQKRASRNSFKTQSLAISSPIQSRSSPSLSHTFKSPVIHEKSKSPSSDKGDTADKRVNSGTENLEEASKTGFLPKNNSPNSIPITTPFSNQVKINRASILRKSYTASLLSAATNEVMEAENSALKSARRSAMKSGLSSSRSIENLSFSASESLLKSSVKKTDIAKLQSSSKRKSDHDFEARAERAAKRLKMETPRSLSKNKVAALLVCHGRSPKNVQRKPLFSEVLKSRLSAAKLKKSTLVKPVPITKQLKKKVLEPSIEVPKTFKFNSTGHANSPDTIVITKKIKKTPAPKTRKGRKSIDDITFRSGREQQLEGVQELFKTPSKLIVSSLKTATSVKKPQTTRVRFSLQNDVQSPSGRKSLATHQEILCYGSPVVPPMRYIGTPRPSRVSEYSLLHTSIAEESPLAQEMNSSQDSNGSSKRKSKRSLSTSVDKSNKSVQFSVYSPSSPTLQFSNISGGSYFGRKSTDFSDISPTSESNSTPKLRPSMPSLNDSSAQKSLHRKCSTETFNQSSEQNAKLSKSYLFGSSLDDMSLSLSNKSGFSVNNSINTSGVFKFSASNSEIFNRSKKNSRVQNLNVSQIPLPLSPVTYNPSSTFENTTNLSPSSKPNESIRSTRSTCSNKNISFIVETPKSKTVPERKATRSSTLNITSNIDTPESSKSTKTGQISNILQRSSESFDRTEVSTRVSSTPKLQSSSNIYSPISSPILSSSRRSLRSQILESVNENFSDVSSNSQVLDESGSIVVDTSLKTPLSTPGKKTRKRSARMYASNSVEMQTPGSKVPIAAVKPSTRKKQESESASSLAESVSLPDLDVINDVSGRSLDRSLAQKVMDSKVSSGFDQPTTSDHPSMNSNISLSLEQVNLSGSSGRRKRKSLASTSVESIDKTNFDFNSAVTPRVPREMFVSPLDKQQDGLVNVTGVKRILNPKGNSPVSSYADVKGVKKLLKTPRPTSPIANYTHVEGIKNLFKTSPVADYTDVLGVKRMYAAPAEPNYMNVKGVRRIFKQSKSPNTPDVTGVEVLFDSPKKAGDEFSQSSTYRPVGMVPPMTRLDYDLESPSANNIVNAEVVSVEVEQISARRNNKRQNPIPHLSSEDIGQNKNLPSVSLRKTRSKDHMEEEAATQNVESKSKDKKEQEEESRAQRTLRGRKPKPQTTYIDELLEQPNKQVLEGREITPRKRGRPPKNHKNKQVINAIDDEKNTGNTKRRGKEQSSVQVSEIVFFEEKTPGERNCAVEISQFPEQIQKPDIPLQREARRTRRKPEELRQPEIESIVLGKRKIVSDFVDTSSNHSPPKKSRGLKKDLIKSDSKTPLSITPSKEEIAYSTSPQQEIPNKSKLRGRKRSKSQIEVKVSSRCKSKRNIVEEVHGRRRSKSQVEDLEIVGTSPLEDNTSLPSKKSKKISKPEKLLINSSPISTRNRSKRNKVEEITVTEAVKSKRTRSSKKDVIKSPEKLSPLKVRSNAKRDKNHKLNTPDSPDVPKLTNQSLKGKKCETILDSPKNTSHSKTGNYVKEKNVNSETGNDIYTESVTSKRVVRRGKNENSSIPDSLDVPKLTKQSLKGKKCETILDSPKNITHSKTGNFVKETNVNNETGNDIYSESVTSKRVVRRGKNENSSETLKKTVKKRRNDDLTETNKYKSKLDEELKEDYATKGPSSSRSLSKSRPEIQQTSTNSKRVQFNTATSTALKQPSPKPVLENKKSARKTAVKTKAVKKGKGAAVKRKTNSPMKSSPPKRSLRTRK